MQLGMGEFLSELVTVVNDLSVDQSHFDMKNTEKLKDNAEVVSQSKESRPKSPCSG